MNIHLKKKGGVIIKLKKGGVNVKLRRREE